MFSKEKLSSQGLSNNNTADRNAPQIEENVEQISCKLIAKVQLRQTIEESK